MPISIRPSEYYRDFVLPTLQEFLDHPADIRRAYLAAITLYHFCDCVEHFTKLQMRRATVVRQLVASNRHFQLVRDLSVLAKHFWLDPDQPGNKGRWLPALSDVHTGDEAAFDDGTYWSDGTSWSDSRAVVRVRNAAGDPVDVADALQRAKAAIDDFLSRNPVL